MRPARLCSHPRPVEFLEPVHDPSFDDSETDLDRFIVALSPRLSDPLPFPVLEF